MSRAAAQKLVLAAVLLYFAVSCFTSATTNLDWEAIEAQAAKNMVFLGRFGVWDFGNFVPWPSARLISTGPTVLFPIALGYKLAGSQPFLPNVVCALLSVGLLSLCCFLVLSHDRSWSGLASLVTAALLMVLIVVRPFYRYWIPLGEVATGLCLLSATLLAVGGPRRRLHAVGPLAVGLLASLAIYAKLVALIPVAALMLWLAIVPRTGRSRVSALTLWAAGALLVVVVFELRRFYDLGSLPLYFANTQDLLDGIRSYGKPLVAPTLAEQLTTRLKLYHDYFGLFTIPLTLPLAAAPFLFYRSWRGAAKPAEDIAAALGIQIWAQLAWWFFIYGGHGHVRVRHVFPVLMLVPWYLHFALLSLPRWSGADLRAVLVSAWVALLIVLGYASPPGQVSDVFPRLALNPRTQALFSAADFVRELRRAHPSAVFWTFGYWQHWDLQLLIETLRFADFTNPRPEQLSPGQAPHYLVTSDLFNWEGNPVAHKVVADNSGHNVFHNQYFDIYEMRTFPFNTETDLPLAIASFGPHSVQAGQPFNPQPSGMNALWIVPEKKVAPWTRIRWNGKELAPAVSPDGKVVTALVPRGYTETRGTVTLELFEPAMRARSAPVYLRIE